LFAQLVSVKVGKTTRLLVKVFSGAGGALKSQFLSPFQGGNYTGQQVRVVNSGVTGVPDLIVVTAMSGKKPVIALFPVVAG
jgi:hypothetical protein